MTTDTHEKVGVYGSLQRESRTERDIEAHALLGCASQLDAARKPEAERALYTTALQRNQRLWTIFQVALCDPENRLPRDLRNTLLNLSHYVDKVSFRAIAEYKPALLQSLIDINRYIAAGLSKNPKAETRAPLPETQKMPHTPVMTTA